MRGKFSVLTLFHIYSDLESCKGQTPVVEMRLNIRKCMLMYTDILSNLTSEKNTPLILQGFQRLSLTS